MIGHPGTRIRLIAALLLTGASTLLAQVVLLRELLSASFGVELLVVLGLGVLLLGGSSGALAGGRLGASSGSATAWLFLALAWLTPLAGVFLRGERLLFGAVPGAFLPLGSQLLGICVAFLPVGLVGGVLFRGLAEGAGREDRGFAWAYSVECAGGVVGGILSTGLASVGWSNLRTACLISFGLAFGTFGLCGGRKVLGGAALLTFALSGAGFMMAGNLDRASAGWGQGDVVEVRDTPYARLTVSRREGQVVVFQDGALLFETEGTTAEEFVHPAALQVERPRRILVLGGSGEGLVREALKHGSQRVVAVEMDPMFYASVAGHLPAEVRKPLTDPRVETVFADPRGYLREHGEWDLILVGAGEPSSGQANRFYTREFFRLASARLRPGGVLALRLRSSENIWTPLLARRNASIHRALAEAFPQTLVLPGPTNVLLASSMRLLRDPEPLVGRWQSRSLHARLVCGPYLRYILTNERMETIRKTLEDVRAPANRDARPICYAFTAGLWLSRFWPGAGFRGDLGGGERMGEGAWFAGIVLAALLTGLLLRFLRRRSFASRALLAFAAGFAGMVLESALLLAYQSGVGALYRDLGLLVSLFMAGLAVGATVAARAGNRFPRTAGTWTILGALLATGGSAATLVSEAGGIWVFALLLPAGGAAMGGLFASATSGGMRVPPIGALYASDLAGAFLGATAGGLLLLPFAGLVASLLVAAGIVWLGGAAFLFASCKSSPRP